MDDKHINLKIENKEVAQFTTPAKIQEWVRAVMSVLGMIVAVIIVGVIVAGIAFLGWAFYRDSQVQPQAASQKAVRTQQGKPAVKADAPVTPQKQAPDLAPWRQIRKDMTQADIRNLLGEPTRVQGGNFTSWQYSSGGAVTFYEGKVYSWNEPQ